MSKHRAVVTIEEDQENIYIELSNNFKVPDSNLGRPFIIGENIFEDVFQVFTSSYEDKTNYHVNGSNRYWLRISVSTDFVNIFVEKKANNVLYRRIRESIVSDKIIFINNYLINYYSTLTSMDKEFISNLLRDNLDWIEYE